VYINSHLYRSVYTYICRRCTFKLEGGGTGNGSLYNTVYKTRRRCVGMASMVFRKLECDNRKGVDGVH